MPFEQWGRGTWLYRCPPLLLGCNHPRWNVTTALQTQRVWIASTSSRGDTRVTRRAPRSQKPRCGLSTPGHSGSHRGRTGLNGAEDASAHGHRVEEHRGIFQSQYIKSFPVRAAVDIGTGGVASLCVARVDASAGAIQNIMYQTQLPLHLEALSTSMSGSASPLSSSSSFTLSERTMEDIMNKMHMLQGVMRRNAFEGLSERAAVLSWPLCLADNAEDFAAQLTRTFKVDVRVLGKSFEVEWPPSVSSRAASGTTDLSTRVDHSSGTASDDLHNSDARADVHCPLKSLLHAVNTSTAPGAGGRRRKSTRSSSCLKTASSSGAMDPRAQLDTLALLAHVAASQCIAPQRVLVVHEDPQRGLRLLGLDTSPADDIADLLDNAATLEERQRLYAIAYGSEQPLLAGDASPLDSHALSSASAHGPPQASYSFVSTRTGSLGKTGSGAAAAAAVGATSPPPLSSSHMRVIEHLLPVDVASAHRYCVTNIQRRPLASYRLHGSSPNPLLAAEFAALRNLIVGMIQTSLPPWVHRKAKLGGVVCGTSHNGGMLNIAARVSQQTHVSLEHLEVHAQHHFCGLTDVLLAESFPNPLLVLPSAALAAAVLRSLESPRITYLPELSVAAALVVQPSLWLHARSSAVRASLAGDPFYATTTAEQRGRTFDRPHRKDNPTAAPGATWAKNGSWNPLSPHESMQGT